MKGRKGFTLIELLVVIAIIAVLAAILFPVFARARKAAQAANCQSNMSQIGRALKMYLSEWHDTYPTNRNASNALQASVQLSAPGQTNLDGTPRRFQYGVNWVEALFPYVEAISKDSAGAWLCGAASNKGQLPGGPLALTSAVSYSFNYNLIEQPEGIIKAAANLMVSREFDRKVNSLLRPANASVDGTQIPSAPFLSASDTYVSPPTCMPKMHNMGSMVMFADSHVKNYSTEFMPNTLTTACWDAADSQWYNSANASIRKTYKAIAISP
jgi:prepilin-type N-terminal cleavage/methylation domain-containing protein